MYEAFYGLSGKPFQLNPDPSFYFESRGHRRARAYLEYGLHQGEGFIVITGEVGAGKTTLLRSVLERLPTDAIVATQIVSTQVEADDMLRLVAQGFGFAAAGVEKSTLLTELRRYCLHEFERGRKALLIVDEAQNLPPRAVEELRMLSNFQIGNRSLVQSFLVGQPELRQMLQDPQMRQLKQRIIASYHLGPMDAEESRSYIEHRLRHVGWNEDPAFDETVFERIHAATGGIPRRMNGLCDRLLLSCYLAAGHQITEGLVQSVSEEMAEELEPADAVGEAGPASREAEQSSSRRKERRSPLLGGGAPVGHVKAADELSPVIDRIDELEERIAFLESRQLSLQTRLKRLTRQGERPEVNLDSAPEPF